MNIEEKQFKKEEREWLESKMDELESDNYEKQLDELIQEIKEKIFKLSLFMTDEVLDYPEIEKIIEGLEGELISLLETKDELFPKPVVKQNTNNDTNIPSNNKSVLEEGYCAMCGCDDIEDNNEDYEPDQDDYDEIEFCCPFCKIEYLEKYINELEVDNEILESQVDDMDDKIDMLEAKMDTLKEHIDYLIENIEIQEQDNENLFDENVNLIELLQEKDREIEKLKVEIGNSKYTFNGTTTTTTTKKDVNGETISVGEILEVDWKEKDKVSNVYELDDYGSTAIVEGNKTIFKVNISNISGRDLKSYVKGVEHGFKAKMIVDENL